MIKISVFYPYKEGAAFNMGIGGGAPGAKPPFVAIGHILMESPQSFQTEFPKHVQKFMADIPNYTAIEPVIQVSEIKL